MKRDPTSGSNILQLESQLPTSVKSNHNTRVYFQSGFLLCKYRIMPISTVLIIVIKVHTRHLSRSLSYSTMSLSILEITKIAQTCNSASRYQVSIHIGYVRLMLIGDLQILVHIYWSNLQRTFCIPVWTLHTSFEWYI